MRNDKVVEILNQSTEVNMPNIYKKNFLTNTVVKIDFAENINVSELASDLKKTILKLFPISEQRKIIGRTIKFSGDKVEIEGDKFSTQWNFLDKDRNTQLVIIPNNLSITYNKYESFERLKSDFTPIIEGLFKNFPDLLVNRLGLRYINEISLDEPSPLLWDDYLNEKLLRSFDVTEDKTAIARCINTIILNYGDYVLNFRYGMHNPDFPTSIRKKIFILDYDASHSDLQEFQEIMENLNKFHDKIEIIFESHIKDDLRSIMYDE